MKDGELHDRLLRIAVLNKDGKSTLSAILHDPDMASEDVTALFGIHRFFKTLLKYRVGGSNIKNTKSSQKCEIRIRTF